MFTMRTSTRYIGAAFISMIIALAIVYGSWYSLSQPAEPPSLSHDVPRSTPTASVDWLHMLDFLPFSPKCTDIKLTLPKVYEKALTGFKEKLNKSNTGRLEGNSGRLQEQTAVYWRLASLPFVKVICETGFNAGHSTLVWLLAKPDTKVFSFDLGVHGYSKPMAKYLQHLFKDRLVVTWGDSTKTLPEFHKQLEYSNITCDLIIVDGGHTGRIAMADFDNFKPMASKTNIVVFDDYPAGKEQGFNKPLGPVWEKKKRVEEIHEIFQCSYPGLSRGFSIGLFTD